VDHDFQGVADLQLLRFDRKRELAERKDAFGLAADVDEQLVLVLGDDDAGEDLTFVENLEALFVQTLLEGELVLFFVNDGGRRCGRLGFGTVRLSLRLLRIEIECASDGGVTSYRLYFIFGNRGTTRFRVDR
jgi:hypothetical protein